MGGGREEYKQKIRYNIIYKQKRRIELRNRREEYKQKKRRV
jgi:hypothetical protein